MPKLVCTTCSTELKIESNDVLVVETAGDPRHPYKVWNSDLWKCPGCGFEVAAGFATQPVRQDHYAADFLQWLEEFKTKYKHVVYDHEKPT